MGCALLRMMMTMMTLYVSTAQLVAIKWPRPAEGGRHLSVCVCVCFCRLLKEDQVQVMSTLFRSHGSRQQLGQWWRSWWWWLRLAFSSRPALNPRIGAKLSLSIHDSFLSFFLSAIQLPSFHGACCLLCWRRFYCWGFTPVSIHHYRVMIIFKQRGKKKPKHGQKRKWWNFCYRMIAPAGSNQVLIVDWCAVLWV